MSEFLQMKSIEPSLTVSFHHLARQMQEEGQTIFDLTAGEAKLPNHPIIIEAIHESLLDNPAGYPPVAGLPALREKATEWMAEHHKGHFEPTQCLTTAGGKYGLFLLLQALLNPGDEVLFSSPYWTSYPSMVKYFGGISRLVPTTSPDFQMTLESLEEAVTSRSKILLLNNANNPTGALYSHQQIEAFLNFGDKHDLVVISDEVYSELTYGDPFVSCAQFEAHAGRTFIVQSCSKNFAMTGWRLGFVFGPKPSIAALTRLQGQSLTSASIVSQWAAIAAFSNALTLCSWVRGEMKRRRDLFVETYQEAFQASIQPPPSAMYVFLPLAALGLSEESAQDSLSACEWLLREQQVATVPGVAFGMEGFARCSFAGHDDCIVGGLHRLASLF